MLSERQRLGIRDERWAAEVLSRKTPPHKVDRCRRQVSTHRERATSNKVHKVASNPRAHFKNGLSTPSGKLREVAYERLGLIPSSLNFVKEFG